MLEVAQQDIIALDELGEEVVRINPLTQKQTRHRAGKNRTRTAIHGNGRRDSERHRALGQAWFCRSDKGKWQPSAELYHRSRPLRRALGARLV